MIDLKLNKLSILHRAAEAYATDNITYFSEVATKLYPTGRFPFVPAQEYPLPLHLFSPRLLVMLTKEEDHLDAFDMWNRITTKENLIRMITASELERTAAESLGKQFELIYKTDTRDLLTKRKQMIGYMIKVAMECFGYMVFSSRMQVSTVRGDVADNSKRKSNYFTTASRYAPINKADLRVLSKQIENPNVRSTFDAITKLIINGETEYQRAYKLQALTSWELL